MGGRVFGCEWFVWKDVRGMMSDGYGDRVVVEKFCEWVEVYVEYFEEYVLGDGGEGKDLREGWEKVGREIVGDEVDDVGGGGKIGGVKLVGEGVGW